MRRLLLLVIALVLCPEGSSMNVCEENPSEAEETQVSESVFTGEVIAIQECEVPPDSPYREGLVRALVAVTSVRKGPHRDYYEYDDFLPWYHCIPHPKVGDRWKFFLNKSGGVDLACGNSGIVKQESSGFLYRLRHAGEAFSFFRRSPCTKIQQDALDKIQQKDRERPGENSRGSGAGAEERKGGTR